MRKTAKTVTFWDPLIDTDQLHCSAQAPTCHSSKRKTTSLKIIFRKSANINGSKHKSPPPPNHYKIHYKAYPCTLPLFQGCKPPNIHPQGAVTQSNFPLYYSSGLGHNGIEASFLQLLQHHW